MRGARYLAEDRGAFEAEPREAVMPVEPAITQASAPLYEVAAVHDGQPPCAWLQMFRDLWSQ